MWSYRFDNPILCSSCDGNFIAFGCESGWIFLFDSSGLRWSKKLIGTYYRGPFNDVNVTAVDVCDGYVAVGTDFVDGKVYVFDLNGREIWKRQRISILSCWERPDDVKFVRLSKEGLAVVSGFMNDKVSVFSLDGEEVYREDFGDFVTGMDFDDILAVGTGSRSVVVYPNRREFEFKSKGVLVVDDWAVFFNDNGILCTLGWSIRAESPIVSANSDYVAFASSNRVSVCDLKGKIVKTFDLKNVVFDLKLLDDSVAIATSDGVYINDEKVYGGKVYKLCDSGVLVGNEKSLSYLELW